MAFLTQGMESKFEMNLAISTMIIMDGLTMPKVAATAPGVPAILCPTKVETLTAMIPGVVWAMA